jgi:hypothetical protein
LHGQRQVAIGNPGRDLQLAGAVALALRAGQ